MKIVDFSEKIIKWREEQEAAMSKKQYEKIDTKELKRDNQKEKEKHEKDALKDDDSKERGGTCQHILATLLKY